MPSGATINFLRKKHWLKVRIICGAFNIDTLNIEKYNPVSKLNKQYKSVPVGVTGIY